MNPSARGKALWGALVATLAAVAATSWWTADDAPAQPPVAPVGPPAQGGAPVPRPAPSLARRADLQPRTPWLPPPQAALLAWGQPAPSAPPRRPTVAVAPAMPAPAVVPPTPAAPPLTYRFVGRIVQEGRQHAMLLSPQGDLKVVVENELVDGQWRVEHIAERAVDLVWMPGAERRRLAIATT